MTLVPHRPSPKPHYLTKLGRTTLPPRTMRSLVAKTTQHTTGEYLRVHLPRAADVLTLAAAQDMVEAANSPGRHSRGLVNKDPGTPFEDAAIYRECEHVLRSPSTQRTCSRHIAIA